MNNVAILQKFEYNDMDRMLYKCNFYVEYSWFEFIFL